MFDGPVTESATAWAERDSHGPSDEYGKSYTDFPNVEQYEFVDRRVTEAVSSRTGSDKDISGDVGTKLFDRPVKESATAWAERDYHGPSDEYGKSYSDFPNGEHYEFVDRRVTEAVTSRPGSENDITSNENYNLVDRPVTELATAGPVLRMTVSVLSM